jgi:hypothetical protein
MYIQGIGEEIVRTSLIPPPQLEGYAYMAATHGPDEEPVQLPALHLLKSLDDLDEEEDEDDDDTEDLEDEDDDEELDEDYEEDEDEDDDDDEDEDDEEEDDDDDVKPLKMA